MPIPQWGEEYNINSDLYSGYPVDVNEVVFDKTYAPYPQYVAGLPTGSDQCAYFSNQEMRNLGLDVWGNAWDLQTMSGPGLVLNGYTGLQKPENFDRNEMIKYNHLAADNFKKNFDIDRLNKNAQYAVNMFFNAPPRQAELDAYNEGPYVSGTHTGFLRFNNETNSWEVVHNIHNKLYIDPLTQVLGSTAQNNKWGITALYNMGNFNNYVPQEELLRLYNEGKDVYKPSPLQGQPLYKRGGRFKRTK